jgi:hypothetical protein
MVASEVNSTNSLPLLVLTNFQMLKSLKPAFYLKNSGFPKPLFFLQSDATIIFVSLIHAPPFDVNSYVCLFK